MKFHDFQPSGFVSDKLTEDLFLELKYECGIASAPTNHRLVGNIERQYSLDIARKDVGKKLLKQLFSMIYEYESRYGSLNVKVLSKDLPLEFSQTWVNFQKKYEFNPIHRHTGVWSFVIWIQIPYSLEEELKNPSSINSSANCPSIFQFSYDHIYGSKEENLYIDKSHEGTIILFPSNLMHCVYPFYTSDNYRISISGNLCFQVP
jgi:hypothetical protein